MNMILMKYNIQMTAIKISKVKLERYLKTNRNLQKAKHKLIKMGNNINIEEA